MLSEIHSEFKVAAKEKAATESEISLLLNRFQNTPSDYLELIREATEIEFSHSDWKYLRIWGPGGCFEMDEAHEISDWIPGAIPIGDDGGGQALIYMTGSKGWGFYLSGFGDLDAEDAEWIASNLRELLCECVGKQEL